VLPGGDEQPQVQVVQGNGQQGVAGAQLDSALLVRAVDPTGNGLPNRTVLWSVQAGGGSISPATGTTDADGYATAIWTLGPAAGANTVAAQVPGVGSVTFTATATTDSGGGGVTPSAERSTLSADPTSIAVASETSTITVRVRDDNGDPIEGATVVLQATGDGNTLTQPSGATGADGIATGTLQSTSPGTKVVSATVNGSVTLSDTVEITVTPARTKVDHLVYLVQPRDVKRNESFSVQAALVDVNGDVVPLSGIVIYLGLFREGQDVPNNDPLVGERFVATVDGVSTYNLKIDKKEKYRLRALTDDLPELGPHGPEPFLFSDLFEVK
jgi:Invasin, domain 3/Bacterial Ig-like domain (group 1)